MITKRMKLVAVATASMLFLAGCGDNTAEGIAQDAQDARSNLHYKSGIQATKHTTKTAKEKAADLTAKGLRKGARGAQNLEEKMDDAADYMSSESDD